MGTAYIAVTIEPREDRVTLFQVEAIAEVEYQTDCGELHDWHVSNFKFIEERSYWDDTARVWTRRKIAECWAPKAIKEFLLEHIDNEYVENMLVEQLTAAGEIAYITPGLRADYHASVL